MKRQIKNNVSWIGHVDWELDSFHGDDYSIHNGSSQNAYLVEEEKTVLIDTVWLPHAVSFVDNLKSSIDLQKIDYIIVNHGEVDHSGALLELLAEIPGTPIYCTANAVKSLQGQYHCDDWNFNVVKTGDTLDIGNGKQLVFVEMRMLHWPDSMATYLTQDNILFSNDAFGQHFAVEGLFNDKADQCLLMNEAIKYYANILTPFSPLVKNKIKEILGLNLEIDLIAPSHGAIWRDKPLQIVEKYMEWSDNYQTDQITVIYDTMWNGTRDLAHNIAREISLQSPATMVKVCNLAVTDKNDVITEVFRSKAIAVGSPTVGNDILSSVAGFLHFLRQMKFKQKKAAVFGCYGWSGEGNKILREYLTNSGFEVAQAEVKSNWNPDQSHKQEAKATVAELLEM